MQVGLDVSSFRIGQCPAVNQEFGYIAVEVVGRRKCASCDATTNAKRRVTGVYGGGVWAGRGDEGSIDMEFIGYLIICAT